MSMLQKQSSIPAQRAQCHLASSLTSDCTTFGCIWQSLEATNVPKEWPTMQAPLKPCCCTMAATTSAAWSTSAALRHRRMEMWRNSSSIMGWDAVAANSIRKKRMYGDCIYETSLSVKARSLCSGTYVWWQLLNYMTQDVPSKYAFCKKKLYGICKPAQTRCLGFDN